jgi:protein-S-isoprenylcysteine O-methyltransferase Ste14
MIRRVLVLGYGAVAYIVFLGSLLYTVGFLADTAVPKDIDDGTAGPAWQAVLVNLALLSLFAVQHSVMARPWFKRWWIRLIPATIERSTYVLAASLLVVLLLWQWRPLPDSVWSVHAGWARAVLWTLYALGWVILVFSSFLIGHFDLFGLRQVLASARERQYVEPEFHEPLLYQLVRHPLMVGFLIAFWAAPDMSVGRLLFVLVASAYIVVAVRFEEHDLRRQLGEPYEQYSRRVPRFVPRFGRRPSALTGRRRATSSAQ